MLKVLNGLAKYQDTSVADLIEGLSPGASAIAMWDGVPLGRHFVCAKLCSYTDGSTYLTSTKIIAQNLPAPGGGL